MQVSVSAGTPQTGLVIGTDYTRGRVGCEGDINGAINGVNSSNCAREVPILKKVPVLVEKMAIAF